MCLSSISDPPQTWRPALKRAAIQGHSPRSALWPPTIRSWSWLPFFAPHSALFIGVEVVVWRGFWVVAPGHQAGFFVGQVVAPGRFEVEGEVSRGLALVGLDAGGWVGSGGIVWSGGWVGNGGGHDAGFCGFIPTTWVESSFSESSPFTWYNREKNSSIFYCL